MTSGVPPVSVVVLSHARPTQLAAALRALAPQLGDDREALVVDNASTASGAVRDVVAGFPQVRLEAQARNLGFTGGMNAGLRSARGRLVLLTEDDIELQPGCVDALVDEATALTTPFLLTGTILDGHTGAVQSAGGEVDLGPPFRMQVHGVARPPEALGRRPFDVGYVSGALIVAPREPLLAIGGFRDDFFMYFEDVELCLRAARRGWRLRAVPSACARHAEPPDGPVPARIAFHKAKNLLATYALHAPVGRWAEAALRYGPAWTARALWRSPREALAVAEGWLWLALHLPALLVDRVRARSVG